MWAVTIWYTNCSTNVPLRNYSSSIHLNNARLTFKETSLYKLMVWILSFAVTILFLTRQKRDNTNNMALTKKKQNNY